MSLSLQPGESASRPHRIPLLDVTRGLALIAMTTFHFSWDLEFFGYATAGLTSQPAFKWYARCIAFSFLLLVGLSFALAHSNGFNRAGFLKRLAQVSGAAALITVGTLYTTPDRFVFFGILHQIAAASLLCVVFMRAPIWLVLLSAIAIAGLPQVFRSALFEHPFLWWTGLAIDLPLTNDYVPVFPWSGYVLFGLVLGRLALRQGLTRNAALTKPLSNSSAKGLAFLGKHSLVYYLVHQPLLFGLLSLVSMIAPPDRSQAFVQSCQTSCQVENAADFCERFCSCVRDELRAKSILNEVIAGTRDVASDPEILDTASLCTPQAGSQP
ncbi:MAG: heparan-alpha-glucosaminide N-acetyltransferase [Rhizobiaceae bacterium]